MDDQFTTPFLSTFAIYWDVPGELTAVAHQGDEVPGLPGVSYAAVSPIVLYESGTLLFSASFSGLGVTSANNSALMRANADGSIEILLRRGDTIVTGPADARVVDIF